MFRNVFALQQNLTNIIVRKEQHFDRVRKYYELLNLTEEELQAYILDTISQSSNPVSGYANKAAKASLFSADEYKVIVEVQKHNKRLSPLIATSIEQKLKLLA